MSFKEKFKEFAAAVGFDVSETEQAPVTVGADPAALPAASASSAALASPAIIVETDAEKAELLRQRENLLADKAKTFASAEVSAHRLTPGEQPGFEAAYLQALKDDAASPLPEGATRAGLIESVQTKRAPHLFTGEQIAPDATHKVLTGEMSEDEQLDASVEEQANSYVATVSPKLTVVKN